MCLAVPMKLIELSDDDSGTAELEGVRYQVNLSLVETPNVGDYLIIHAGFAIEKLNEEEANERLELFEELARTQSDTDR